jgi:SAM-dependent methyltransferase
MGTRKAIRRALARAVRLLPPPRDEAAMRLLYAVNDLIRGRAPASRQVPDGSAEPARPEEAAPVPGGHIAPAGPPLERPPGLGDTSAWASPPISHGHDVLTKVLYNTGAAPQRYDVELLEALNQEYAGKPIVPAPPSYAPGDRIAVARQRIGWVQQLVDLRGKTTLEIGCSNGYEAWLLAHNLACDAHGVDVNARGAWADLEGDRVHFECADLAVKNPYPPEMFDVIYSFVVWEHVTHPGKLLRETYSMLKPGGFAWIRANLFCGPQASHRYREISFPWPHLLFSEDVIRDWDAKNGRGPKGPAWVNRLTWDNYLRLISEIGFALRHVHFQEADWDEEFYQRFEDILGRYPKRDLKRDFFLAVLEKPR